MPSSVYSKIDYGLTGAIVRGLNVVKKGWRVLIVDDDQDNAAILAMLLHHQGHETQIANDGSEATAKALEFCPEVILLDIGLPKMDGYKVCRAIRGQPFGEDIIIIAVSGWQRDLQKSECRFDAYLLKPVVYTDLMSTIASIISGGSYKTQEVLDAPISSEFAP